MPGAMPVRRMTEGLQPSPPWPPKWRGLTSPTSEVSSHPFSSRPNCLECKFLCYPSMICGLRFCRQLKKGSHYTHARLQVRRLSWIWTISRSRMRSIYVNYVPQDSQRACNQPIHKSSHHPNLCRAFHWADNRYVCCLSRGHKSHLFEKMSIKNCKPGNRRHLFPHVATHRTSKACPEFVNL